MTRKEAIKWQHFLCLANTPRKRWKKISAERTNQAVSEIKKLGGEVQAMHVLLGEYDLLFCVALPGIEEAMKASVTLSKLTGIAFTTCPAITVETFDTLVKTR